jgi:hypothetical protein
MQRVFRVALGVVIVLALADGEARAQYYGGYGPWGWGGWAGGSTVQGDIARGLGYFNIGAGIYNEETARANAINADTIMRWNEYMFLAQQEANRREYLRRQRLMRRDAAAGEAMLKRVREHPDVHDITNGDALNAILDQLSDPRIQSSSLRLLKTPISREAIREIPFEIASEAVAITLDRLTGEENWPPALQGEPFAPERKAYREAIAKALKEDEEGKISPETLRAVNDAVSRLRAKLEANKPADPAQYAEAANFLKALTAMTRMLQDPDMSKILADLDSVKETTLGSLLAFMHAHNLRFGPATTDAQRTVYRNLYPVLAEARDRVLKEAGIGPDGHEPVARNERNAVDFFQGLHLENLDRRPSRDRTNP